MTDIADTTDATASPDPQQILDALVEKLLARLPEAQRGLAAPVIRTYAPALATMAIEDAWQAYRRLAAGDLEVVIELGARLTDDAFVARVKANTARWEKVAAFNAARDRLREQFALQIAPIILAILAALVGL